MTKINKPPHAPVQLESLTLTITFSVSANPEKSCFPSIRHPDKPKNYLYWHKATQESFPLLWNKPCRKWLQCNRKWVQSTRLLETRALERLNGPVMAHEPTSGPAAPTKLTPPVGLSTHITQQKHSPKNHLSCVRWWHKYWSNYCTGLP